MRVFAVSGFSFSGKTFLLEQIIQSLTSEGYKVATIKGSIENIIAPEGTDTWRHGKAGANPTILSGPDTTTVRFNRRVSISEIANVLEVDFLLLEGFKQLEVPKFWCIGEESEPVEELPKTVKAVVIWEGTAHKPQIEGIPTISNADIETLVRIVKDESVGIESIPE